MILHLSLSVYLLVLRQRLYENFVGKNSTDGLSSHHTFSLFCVTDSHYVTNMNLLLKMPQCCFTVRTKTE